MIALLYASLALNILAGVVTLFDTIHDAPINDHPACFALTVFLTPINIIWLAQL